MHQKQALPVQQVQLRRVQAQVQVQVQEPVQVVVGEEEEEVAVAEVAQEEARGSSLVVVREASLAWELVQMCCSASS